MASGPSALRWPKPGALKLDIVPANLLFSLNSIAATALALYVSFAADLPRPYWAVLTVYITANPLTGALRSKALYRVIGTVLGGAAAIALVPNLVNAPSLLSTALAVWVGICLYISLLDRTPRAYVFLLGGYTAAIIGFPSVDAPQDIFDTAVARVEEITVGILSATLVHSIFFPREVTVALNARVAEFLRDGRDFASAAILGIHGPREEQERRRLAADITSLQILATHLPFDTSNLRPRMRAVRGLQDRLALLLPLLSAIEDRLSGLRNLGALPNDLDAVLQDTAAYLRNPDAAGEEADALMARSLACAPPLDFARVPTIWPAMLATSAAVRISQLIETWRDSLSLARFVADPRRAPPRVGSLVSQGGRRPLHRDHGLALLSAAALIVAVLASCAYWIATAWPQGSIAAMFAAVFMSFFATLDDPAPAIAKFLFWSTVSIPIAAFYLFAVLPALDGFVMLVLALTPLYLVLGYMQADPVQSTRAIPLILGITGSLALQETYNADFAAFLNSSMAQIIGVAVALWTTRIFRSVGSAWSARRILKSGWRDLADLAAGRRLDDRNSWTSLMLDRLGLITSRLVLVESSEDLKAADALADLRAGLNIIELRQGEWQPPELSDMLMRLSETYAARDFRTFAGLGPQLLEAIDRTIAALGRDEPRAPSPESMASLVGLRRALYPDAPGYAQ